MNDIMPLNQEVTQRDITQEIVNNSKFMKRPQGRTPKEPLKFITYILKIIFLNPWILLGIIGGIFAYKLINTPEGVIFGVLIGGIIGYILFRGNQ